MEDSTFSELLDIIENVPHLLGDLSPEDAVLEWKDADISADAACEYIEVGCWQPLRVAALIRAGVVPSHLVHAAVCTHAAQARLDTRSRGRNRRVEDLEKDFVEGGLGYAHSNGDVSTREVVAAVVAAGLCLDIDEVEVAA